MRPIRVLATVFVGLTFLATAAASTDEGSSAGEALDLRAPDGVVLRATYYAPGQPGPGVLLLHMCNSDRSAWAGLGARLAARGFHALALDYRGYGESGGERPEDSQERQSVIEGKWPGDIDRAFDYLVAQPGVDGQRLGAAGGSCGVNQAVQLARRHPEIKTLVLLAGATNQAGETFLAHNPWMPLFASASHDDGNAVEILRWLLGFSSHPANRFVEYQEGGHGTEMFAVHDDLEPAIVDWFERHLVKDPVVASGPTTGRPGPSARLAAQVRRPGGAQRLREELHAARARGETVALPPEGVVNLYGYELLESGQAKLAVDVFRLNVDAHPRSANTYDSLADAYLADGQRALAVGYSRKALEALAGDPGADEARKTAIRQAAQAKLRDLGGTEER